MACVALTSLMATIELEFLKPDHRVCVDDEKPLKSLFQKLFSLQDFVENEYNKAKGGGLIIRDVEIKIRDFALKAEDDIEIQLRNILLAKHKEHQAMNILHQTLLGVAKDAGDLLNIINNPSNEAESTANHSLSLIHWSSQCSPELEDIMFGRDNFFNGIRDHILLSDSDPTRRVASIFGVPCIGKTSLCKKLYADEGVVSYFHIQAWLTIPPPQQYNVQQLLCALLQSMRPTLVNEIDMGTPVFQLKHQLYNHLKCKRYLVVLDDVCKPQLWDDIQQCFPDDSNGSRILLTTRFSECVIPYQFPLPFLTPSDSWDLFCHKLSLKRCMSPKFEEIGKRLVEECQGLPRSILMVAHRLSKCNYTLKEWKKVEKELQSLGTLYGDTHHSSKLTDMYNQLPQHLKLCFLYFAVFPKGIYIRLERIARLWIAEGFVKPLMSVPLEDIAYMYINDLVRRGLVLTKLSIRKPKGLLDT